MIELALDVLTKEEYKNHAMRKLFNDSGITANKLKDTLAEFSMHAVAGLPSAAQAFTENAQQNRKRDSRGTPRTTRSSSSDTNHSSNSQQLRINPNVNVFMEKTHKPLSVNTIREDMDDFILPVD